MTHIQVSLQVDEYDVDKVSAGQPCTVTIVPLGMDFETNMIRLNVLVEIQEVRVLHVIPYESSRKRMSVIVQLMDGSIYLYSKV